MKFILLIIFINIFVIALLILFSLFYTKILIQKQNQLKCPGSLNPNVNSCYLNGNLKLPIERNSNCDPIDTKKYEKNLLLFILLIENLFLNIPSYEITPSSEITPLSDNEYDIYSGIFYFANKALLKILPSDFGQNYVTPYGIPSFPNYYINCIDDLKGFTNSIIPNNKNPNLLLYKALQYVGKKYGNDTCPFQKPLTNNSFYLQLGLLGANSILPNQIMILSGTMPTNTLNLYYWSFHIYLADRYNSKDLCAPYNHVYFASILPPFNIFTYIPDKNMNDFTFAIMISINDDVNTNNIYKQLFKKFDYVHRFNIPSGENTMVIQDNLINPNHLTNQSKIYDYTTDRFTILFRMNQSNNATKTQKQDYELFKINAHFQFDCIDFKNTTNFNFYSNRVEWPQPLPPLYNELNDKELITLQNQIINDLSIILNPKYTKKKIHCFESLTSIYAPILDDCYNNKILYTNGLQAIQMGSNANGDSYDGWYKLSVPQCLGMNDVFMSIAVNHSKYKNSIYCSMNLVDKNKGRGIQSFEFFENDDIDMYVVLTSRNQKYLDNIQKQLMNLYKNQKIAIRSIYLESGPCIDWKTPLCDSLTYIERMYINPSIIEDNTQKYFKEVDSKLWKNMTHPQGNLLLDPIFIKWQWFNYDFIYILILFILLIIIILIIAFSKGMKPLFTVYHGLKKDE
jgi:hypothetical protein